MREYIKDGRHLCQECNSGDARSICRNCKPDKYQDYLDYHRRSSRGYDHEGRLMLDRIKLRLTDGGT